MTWPAAGPLPLPASPGTESSRPMPKVCVRSCLCVCERGCLCLRRALSPSLSLRLIIGFPMLLATASGLPSPAGCDGHAVRRCSRRPANARTRPAATPATNSRAPHAERRRCRRKVSLATPGSRRSFTRSATLGLARRGDRQNGPAKVGPQGAAGSTLSSLRGLLPADTCLPCLCGQLALEAVEGMRIYTFYGRYENLREALQRRGWVEKPPPSSGTPA
jgi:hypothetical protein